MDDSDDFFKNFNRTSQVQDILRQAGLDKLYRVDQDGQVRFSFDKKPDESKPFEDKHLNKFIEVNTKSYDNNWKVNSDSVNPVRTTSPFLILMIVVVIVVVSYSCFACFCMRRRRDKNGIVYNNAPVVVTSTSHTAANNYAVQVAPGSGFQTTHTHSQYPAQHYPMPQAVVTTSQTPYPPMNQPMNQGMPMPMPMPMPTTGYPHPQPVAPYPPVDPASVNPPSYDQVVGPAGTLYTKQAPYNPHYAQN